MKQDNRTAARLRILAKNPGLRLKLVAILAIGATALIAAPNQKRNTQGRTVPKKGAFMPGEILVSYHKHVSRDEAYAMSRSMGDARVVRTLSHTPKNQGPIQLLRWSPASRSLTMAQAMEMLRRNPDVASVQPNFIYRTRAVPNDTSYGQLWGMNNTGQTISSPVYGTNNPGTASLDIQAQSAWDTITDCSSVVVAVIDTGVNYNHEDLSSNMVSGSYTCPGGTGSKGCDFVGTGDADPMDYSGHGTHVAGTIGAVGNNSTGVAGVCWTAKILAVRVLSAAGSGTTADIVEGLNFAIGTAAGQGQAKVVNMSLGGPSSDTAFNTALTTAATNDVVVVVAAGNSSQNHNTTADYPCDYTQANIICVAALDQSFSLASFSDYDNNATASLRTVDVGAPGTNILSTYYGTTTTISETFTGGGSISWTRAGDLEWGSTYGNCEGGVLNITSAWCAATTAPSNSINARVYKSFDLSSYDLAVVEAYAWFDLSHTGDYFRMNFKGAGGDPFSSGTELFEWQGAVSTFGLTIPPFNNFLPFAYELPGCNTASCTVGFQFVTDATTNSSFDGAAVRSFSISGRSLATDTYEVQMGTSMASPMVAGIATMLRARNPNYTYADVVNAILNGGNASSSLTSITKSGNAASAFGALKQIPVIQGVGISSP